MFKIRKWNKNKAKLVLVISSYAILTIAIVLLWVKVIALSNEADKLKKLSESYFEIITNTDNFLSYKTDHYKTDMELVKKAINALNEKITKNKKNLDYLIDYLK